MSETPDAKQLRALEADFWFEAYPSISDPFWHASLAVTWIAWREEQEALRHSSDVQISGRRHWLNSDARGRMVEPREAERLLLNALRAGTVTAFGLTAERMRLPIGRHEWIDLRLFEPSHEVGFQNAISVENGLHRYTDVRIAGPEMLVEFPSSDRPPQAGPTKKPRGPKPLKRMRVYNEMRALPLHQLSEMKEAEMAARFAASDRYCVAIRNQIESEQNSSEQI